jgi:hypothetical protein
MQRSAAAFLVQFDSHRIFLTFNACDFPVEATPLDVAGYVAIRQQVELHSGDLRKPLPAELATPEEHIL